MNDDFAPRPCRCVAAIAVAVCMSALLIVSLAVMWSMSRELTEAREVIADHNRTIDQQERIIAAWVEAHPPTDGELEPGAMGARPFQPIRDLTREANEAVIEVREFVRDVKEGRLGAHVEGSLWHGTADVTLRKAQ